MKMNVEARIFSLLISIVSCARSASESTSMEGGRVLDPIYWNATNSIFSNRTVVDVEIDDKLDLICPRRRHHDVITDQLFYFKLYLVTADEYKRCNATRGKRLITCDVPHREKKYTFFFQQISPSPWGLEFEPDTAYYVVSTSEGTRAGVDNMEGGVCSRFNMKLQIRVHSKKQQDGADGSDEESAGVDENGKSPHHSTLTHINVVTADANDDPAEPRGDEEDSLLKKMWMGIVMGACVVLFILFLLFAAYKLHRRRRALLGNKYPTQLTLPDPHSQVTLLPIQAAPWRHTGSDVMQQHRAMRCQYPAPNRESPVYAAAPYDRTFLASGEPVVAV